MQSMHDFLDTGLPVPPMHIKEIDVVGPELLQGSFDRKVHGLEIVSRVIDFLDDLVVARLEVGGVLGRDEQLVSDSPLLGPFSDEQLRRFVLTRRR